MAANFNQGSHNDPILASVFNQLPISFHPPRGRMNGSSGAIPDHKSVAVNCAPGIIPCADASMINSVPPLNTQAGTSAASLLDSVSGSSHDTDLAVEWSNEEQSRLERGLAKYADIPNIWKYIKIAAMLPEKTVRDVAMRCRWMKRKENGKRRKADGIYSGKKMSDRSEKLVESSMSSLPPSPSVNMAACPLKMHHIDHKEWMSCEVSEIGSATWSLLNENAQVLGHIMANLVNSKIQENIDLFFRTRNNIIAILNNMREMPGIMSQMPPLPVSINEELVNAILPNTVQAMMFSSTSGI